MAANFEVKFIVDRVSGNYKIQLTDTSTGFTLVKANTKITFPDGYVIENTDVSNPDISSAGGSVQKNLRLDVNNKPVTGDYKINFTGYDASDNEYTSQKQFNFTFSEPSIVIQDLSDSGVPVVKFKDITSWGQANFTANATSREFDVDYPSTSAISGTNKTQSEINLSNALEIDMVNNLNYYEGVYGVTLSVDITYTHTNGYLSVQYKRNSSNDFAIKKTPSQSDLLNKINQYKENIDEYKTTSPDVYAKYAEEYDNVLALYSHIVSRYKLGIGDGAQDSIEELLDLIEDQTVHVYLSTPLTPFSIDEDDFGANALITKLKSEIGTFDADGNLQTIAKAFADEVFEVDATDFKAEASKLSTLLAQFGTYDSETNTFSFLATADYFEQVKTYADDNSASAVALDILLAQFGTYDAETETFTFSSTADYFNEVKNYADNDKASAQALTTLTSQFGSYDPATNTFTFDNAADYFEQVKTYADENSAAASKISSIGSAFGSFDGNTFNFSEAKITEELNTYTGLDFSNSQYFIDIEAEIDSKPIVFRQASEPATTYATGSLWYDTDNDNKVYILNGDPKTWTLTDDSRIGATATHLTTLTAAFGSYDPQTGLTIDTQADYFAEVKSYADTESASATKIENLGAELVTFDANGNVTGVVLSAGFKSAIDTFVSDEANSALASKVEGLRVDIEGEDGTGGITAQVTENQQVVAARPKIFRQDEEPGIEEPIGSLWFDTNDNNKAYVLTNGATPSWQLTRDEGIISDIAQKPFIFRQTSAPATTNPAGSLWYDTTNNANTLYVLVGDGGDPEVFTWTTTQDSDIATAQATADGRPKVFRQDDEPATSNPEFSIWYDTDDNNLTYILLGDGGDPEQFSWTATIDGRVTDLLDFAESKYSLTADADGVVTGLELYSASGPNTTVSTFKITADKFIVRESSTDFVPFTLDGSQLKLDVPLNGVSGSFSGSLTAATGTFAGNVNGQVDGTSASTIKSGAADGATAKGITDNLTSVVEITSSDIAIVNTDETKAFYDAGTPFYVDNVGDFSLGDKLKYDNSENLLTISGAVTIESVSGLDKSDVGLGNVDNTSVANILDGSSGAFDGDVTGTVDGTAASTVKTNAADGASAKEETDKLTSVVTLTNSDIAIINEGETKTYNDSGTPFYVDNTGQFSLGNKLSFDGSNLSVSGTITMSASSTIDGTAASTVKSGAADGANAKDTTDNLESVITITSTKIYQGTGSFGNANTGFYLDDAGQFSLKDKLSFDGSILSVDGSVTATGGSIGGVSLASNKLYVGTGTYNNANTAFYLDDAGQFSLKDKLSWDGSTLSINGQITSTSGSIGGWEINSTELKSPAISGVNRLKFSPTSGFIVNDNDNQTSLLVNYGALSSLSSTTTGVTFPDVSNAEVASFDGTVSAGNTLITIPGANERHIYSTNYLTASFPGANTGGAYSYQITVDAITQQLALLTGTSSYLKATMALHVQIATDTSFSNVIKDVELWRSDVQGNNATVNFPGVTKDISFSITNSISNVYLRFYWYRMYVVAYNDSIEFYPRTFNISSADANDDLVFLIYKGTTELTNEGVQIINDPTTYFKVDRANFVSGNPYVDIGGDVKIDGDLEVTGSINIVGDVENSDVSASNLAQRLGEITSDITVGASSSVDVIFPGNVTFQGSVTGGDVTVSNLETRLGEIDSNINIGHSAGVTITMRENVVVTGDLTVQGNVTTENTTQLHISDSLIHLADGNENSDSIDIGFVGHYSPDSGTTKQHAGIFRDADNGEWYIFDEYVDADLDSETNPTNVIDRADSTFSLGVVNATTFKGALTGNASTASTAAKWTDTVAISLGGTSKDLDGSTDLTWTITELGITKANIDALNINADQLDGYGTLGSQNWFGGIPIVHTDGVMEIGKYIDFHDSDDTTDDFDYRLTSNNGSLSGSGNFSVGANTITAGTFVGDLEGDVTGNLTGDVTAEVITVVKEDDEPTINMLRGGADPSTNEMISQINFQTDYSASPQTWAKIDIHTNTSAVRTDMDFAVKSTTGNLETALKLQGGSNKPRAFFYNDVKTDGKFLGPSTISATVPYFSFDGDNNTGVGRATNNKVSLIAEGVKALEASDTGVSITGDLDVGGTLTADGVTFPNDLVTSADFSATDNRFKLKLTKAGGGTIEASFDDVVLSNAIDASYVPYVTTSGGNGDTTNAILSNSFLKINSNTLELDWTISGSPGYYQERNIKMRKQGSWVNEYKEATYDATSITFVDYVSSTNVDIATISASYDRITINNAYSLPAGDGTSGQVLTTNGSGNLSWADSGSNASLDDVTTVNGTTSNSISVGGLTANNLLLKGGTDSTIGTMFVWRLSNSSTAGTTWRKVCDVSLPTGNFTALSMDILFRYTGTNYGDSASLVNFRYTASFRRSHSSQDSYDDAILYGNNPAYLRIVKTSTGVYELQARSYANNRGIIVEYMVTGGNANNVTPTTTNVNGSTTGTVYTASTSSYPELELTGSIYIDNNTVINANGFQGVSTYTQNLYITSSGTSAQNRIDNNGSELYITYGGTSNTALTINNSTGNVSLTGEMYATEYNLPSGGMLDWANGDARIVEGEVNNYSLSFQTYDGSAVTTALRLDGNNAATFTGTVTHQGLSMTDGTGIDQLKTYTQSLTLTTGWQDTGINGADLATGTYIFEMYTNDYGVGGGHYSERYAGIITWLSSNTNSTVADEIVISSRAGHAPNSGDIQLRILRTSSVDTDDLKLQIKANYNASGASNYTFKFRRVI